MKIHLIAVPYDSARRGERMGAGPPVLLRHLGALLRERGDQVAESIVEAPGNSWRAEIGTAFELARGVAGEVRAAIARDAFPLVLSGNCGPAAMGCVAALEEPPAVCWFDAHGDFNTPETTVGGFLDGMPLATVTGKCWGELARGITGLQPVGEESVVLIGARDLDPLEARALDSSSIHRVREPDLRTHLPAVLAKVGAGRRDVYIHLDVDVLDPSHGRVNGYAVAGGLLVEDVAWAIEQICRAMRPAAASITAFDPATDPSNRALDAVISSTLALLDACSRSACS